MPAYQVARLTGILVWTPLNLRNPEWVHGFTLYAPRRSTKGMLLARNGWACISIPSVSLARSFDPSECRRSVDDPVHRETGDNSTACTSIRCDQSDCPMTIDCLSINDQIISNNSRQSSHCPIDRHHFTSLTPDSPAELRPVAHEGCTLGELRPSLIGTLDRIG